jgi:2-keto-4-pentenoate hydratase/2-oxohepta-3-ene-1,7-dioic acid hydratase in catechol pathway
MRWCRVEYHGSPRFGYVADDQIILVNESPFDDDCRPTGEHIALAGAQFLPPMVPPTFYAVGLNYTAHIEHARQRGMATAKLPERPEVGYRANSALIGHGAAVIKPADCNGRFEAEGELVAVIGETLRRCTRDEAAAGIFGWTIGNDVSARDWQHSDRTFWRSKNSDTFKPMGPWIETDVDPLRSETTIAADGVIKAQFKTGAMIFDPYEYICEISRYITLSPGDVLWMGTDGVVPMETGTTLSVTVSGIGTLSNPIVQEAAPEEER